MPQQLRCGFPSTAQRCFEQDQNMDILHRITRRIDALPAGEQWVVSAQDLWISRADFQSISVFLSRESQKGGFSVSAPAEQSVSVTVTKH